MSALPFVKGKSRLSDNLYFLSNGERQGHFNRHSRLRLRGGRLRRESRKACKDWIPAYAGMTLQTAVSLPLNVSRLLEGVAG